MLKYIQKRTDNASAGHDRRHGACNLSDRRAGKPMRSERGNAMKVIDIQPKQPARHEIEAAYIEAKMTISCMLHLTNEAHRQMHGIDEYKALQIIDQQGSKFWQKYKTLFPDDATRWEREHKILTAFLSSLPAPDVNKIRL